MSDEGTPGDSCEHRFTEGPCGCTLLLFTCRGCERRSCNVHGTVPYCYDCRVIINDLEEKRMRAALKAEIQRRREPIPR